MKTYILATGGIGILLALTIIWLIRKDHMHVQYSLWWMSVAATTVVLGLFPGILDWAGHLLGIAYPPTLLFLLAIIALLLKALLADIERSRNKSRMLRLAQRVVMLEDRLRELSQRDANNQNDTP